MRRQGFPFWRFSLRTYRRPGVAQACLALQDECGADVNVLLYCCWMGSRGKCLDRRGVRSAMSAVGRWQDEVVRPLRRARRAIRKDPRGCTAEQATALRQHIAAAELDAEYLEQQLLAAEASRASPAVGSDAPRAAAANNLSRYVEALGAAPGSRQARNLRVLADAVGARTVTLDRTPR
jgi:uncharacterized protein (TIGR02444 family)